MDNAFDYIIANQGIDTETSYPYLRKASKCGFKQINIGANMTGNRHWNRNYPREYSQKNSGMEVSFPKPLPHLCTYVQD